MAPRGGTTKALYLHNGRARTQQTIVTSIQPLTSLPESDQALFKQVPNTDQVLTTSETIFYPQGGGQPSDVGHIHSTPSSTSTSTSNGPSDNGKATFVVSTVRYAPSSSSILHCGHFSPASPTFQEQDTVEQSVDSATRDLHSRVHTAGHILSAAVALMKLPGIDEGTRAMHFPESAFVDFKSLIEGKQKDTIQAKVDDLVQGNRPVHIRFWPWEEARAKCNISPDEMGLDESESVRAVEIEGAGAYPCGGTHVETTGEVGKILVRRITRSKGISKISYSVS